MVVRLLVMVSGVLVVACIFLMLIFGVSLVRCRLFGFIWIIVMLVMMVWM